MKIGSLFSGIGGLELGLEVAGLGHTVWQVEADEFCRRVLAKHWPKASRKVCDVKEAGRDNLEPVDLICGGFPCQDVSSAGKGAGLGGSRSGLWFHFLRVVNELRPEWVVVENVTSGASRWFDVVMAGLEESCYQALSIPLSAADVGALHLRRREFIVAWRSPDSDEQGPERSLTVNVEVAEECSADQDATNPQRNEVRQQQGRGGRKRRSTGQAEPGHDGRERGASAEAPGPVLDCWRSTEPDLVRGVHGLPDFLDVLAVPATGHERGEHDVARRRALGNAVVPQCAEVIGYVIRELIERMEG